VSVSGNAALSRQGTTSVVPDAIEMQGGFSRMEFMSFLEPFLGQQPAFPQK
jgi:hypothetical protein